MFCNLHIIPRKCLNIPQTDRNHPSFRKRNEFIALILSEKGFFNEPLYAECFGNIFRAWVPSEVIDLQ